MKRSVCFSQSSNLVLILLIYSLIDIQKQGLVKCPGILWLNQVDMLAITYCVPVLRAPQYMENIEEELDINTVTVRDFYPVHNGKHMQREHQPGASTAGQVNSGIETERSTHSETHHMLATKQAIAKGILKSLPHHSEEKTGLESHRWCS